MEFIIPKNAKIDVNGKDVITISSATGLIAFNVRNIVLLTYPEHSYEIEEKVPEHWLVRVCGGSEITLFFLDKETAYSFVKNVMFTMI